MFCNHVYGKCQLMGVLPKMRAWRDYRGFVVLVVICVLSISLSADGDAVGETPGRTRAAAMRAGQNWRNLPRQTCDLETISVFDYRGQVMHRPIQGQFERVSPDGRNERVKVYPDLKSAKPLYGTLTVNRNYLNYGGIPYSFVLDESAGTGKGYDRLYFDVNGDLDLTNDGVLKQDTSPPKPLPTRFGSMTCFAFQCLRFEVNYGDTNPPWPVVLIPYVQLRNGAGHVRFITTTAKWGKVQLGGEEVEMLLTQGVYITGRWNLPMVDVMVGGEVERPEKLSSWHVVDGKFLRFNVTPPGDVLRTEIYLGAFGTLVVAGESAYIERGLLQAKEEGIIDIARCERIDGKIRLPVGDYLPLRLVISTPKARVRLAVEPDTTGRSKTPPPTFEIRIRKDKPFELELGDAPEVVFQSPSADQQFKPGDEIQIKAVLRDTRVGALVAELEITKQGVGPIKTSDGTEHVQFGTVEPHVQIVDSSGKVVAEGKMPFG